MVEVGSKQMQKGVAARAFLFAPGGPLACELSRHGVVLKVNDWLFAHGGILPHHGKSTVCFSSGFLLHHNNSSAHVSSQ